MNRITVTELEPYPGQQWKCGDEYLPFHPQASHVPPDYRDGWNRCYWMAVAAVARATNNAQPVAHPVNTDRASGSPANTDDGQVNKESPRALLSAQGCELATDATKQLGEHSVHLAATPIDQDFRMRPASSEAAPSADGCEEWVLMMRQGFVPVRKGPFRHKKLVEQMLRDLYELHPDAICVVIDMPHTSYPQDGREWVDMYGDQRRRSIPRPARPVARPANTSDASGSPSSYRARPSEQKRSASVSPIS